MSSRDPSVPALWPIPLAARIPARHPCGTSAAPPRHLRARESPRRTDVGAPASGPAGPSRGSHLTLTSSLCSRLSTPGRRARRDLSRQPRGDARPRSPRSTRCRRASWPAAASGRSNASASAASCCRASGSTCSSTGRARSSSCPRWPGGTPMTRSAAGSSPASARSAASSAWSSPTTPRSRAAPRARRRCTRRCARWRSRASNRLPLVNLTESGGADLPKQAEIFVPGGAELQEPHAAVERPASPPSRWSSASSTAGGAYVPGMSDYMVLQKEAARVFLGGPPLVKMAIDEDADEEELGGAEMHARTSRPGRLPRHRTRPTPAGSAARSSRTCAGASSGLRASDRAPDAAGVRPRRAARHRQRRRAHAVRGARGASRASSTARASRSSSRCTAPRWYRLGRAATATRSASSPTTGSCSARSRRRARSSSSCATGTDTPILFVAEHHRLHGRHALRAGRHHQGRRQAHQRGVQLDGPAPHADGRRVLRRRELRHGRPRLRPAVRLHLAQPPHRRDGPQAARRRPGRSSPGRRPRAPASTFDEAPSPRCATPSRQQVEAQSTALYATGRLWDDGIIDPRDSAYRPRARAVGHPLHRSCRAPQASASSGCDRDDLTQPRLIPGSSSPTAARSPAGSSRTARRLGHRDGRRLLRLRTRTACTCAAPTWPSRCLGQTSRGDLPRRRADPRRPPGARAPTRSTPATASSRRTRTSRGPSSTPGSPGSGRRRSDRGDGSKVEAKQLAAEAGVPLVPGAELAADDAARHRGRRGATVGYPLLVKASAGGGGKGMRLVDEPAELLEAVAGRAPRGRLRVRRPDGLPRALPRRRPARRGAGLRRQPRQRRPPLRARVLDPAPPPEGRRGVARRRGSTDDAARAMYRRGGRAGRGDRLRRRRHRRVHRRRRRVGRSLLPGDEHAPAGRASGHRGDRPGSTWSQWQLRVAEGERLPLSPGRDQPARARDRGAPLRRGPGQRLPAEHRDGSRLGRRRAGRRGGHRRRAPAARSPRSTTRCSPRSSSTPRDRRRSGRPSGPLPATSGPIVGVTTNRQSLSAILLEPDVPRGRHHHRLPRPTPDPQAPGPRDVPLRTLWSPRACWPPSLESRSGGGLVAAGWRNVRAVPRVLARWAFPMPASSDGAGDGAGTHTSRSSMATRHRPVSAVDALHRVDLELAGPVGASTASAPHTRCRIVGRDAVVAVLGRTARRGTCCRDSMTPPSARCRGSVDAGPGHGDRRRGRAGRHASTPDRPWCSSRR